ncbi:hypothetical protein DIPPA_22775 [Diplonema papillatum]|nr:hypothetical protein DIPPA_22775 [Diplonema papillatum]
METDELLAKVEDFFLTSLSHKIGEFMNDEAQNVALLPLDQEQPLHNMEIFKRYQNLAEKLMEEFLSKEGIDAHAVADVCRRQEGEATAPSFACIEYLLAMTEYDAFMQLAADHVSCQQWEVGDALEADELGD